MKLVTTRFGTLELEAEDILRFPEGLIGLEDCRQWALLADAQNDALAWMQSADRADVALPVVSPRRFLPNYRIRVARHELAPLRLPKTSDAEVLVIVSRAEGSLTLNLKAPIVINLRRRLGRQVITNGESPVRHLLGSSLPAWKRIA
jgi:flagellar assembly factor FliW